MIGPEEDKLATWKDSLYKLAKLHVADPTTRGRAAAVRCLAALPLDDKAATAIALLKDEDWEVRVQVLASFADRPELMSIEEILPMLYDPQPELARLAVRVLQARNLTQDQISLAKLLVHPKPGVAGVSHPAANEAGRHRPGDLAGVSLPRRGRLDPGAGRGPMAGHLTPEALRRLAEIAATDKSPAVRKAARKLVPATEEETTAALPPLPGSTSLNPKAN